MLKPVYIFKLQNCTSAVFRVASPGDKILSGENGPFPTLSAAKADALQQLRVTLHAVRAGIAQLREAAIPYEADTSTNEYQPNRSDNTLPRPGSSSTGANHGKPVTYGYEGIFKNADEEADARAWSARMGFDFVPMGAFWAKEWREELEGRRKKDAEETPNFDPKDF